MRPVLLEIEGFGPFSGREVVDFRELGSNQLFLICGATGAGKTTVLDAICFALYGESSGEERQKSDLRSLAADPTKATAVALVFVMNGETWRIERSPAWDRQRPGREGRAAQASKVAL